MRHRSFLTTMAVTATGALLLTGCGGEAAPTEVVDASADFGFNAEGLPCLNIANGTAHNHEPDEFVTVEALEGALDVALTLVECSGSR